IEEEPPRVARRSADHEMERRSDAVELEPRARGHEEVDDRERDRQASPPLEHVREARATRDVLVRAVALETLGLSQEGSERGERVARGRTLDAGEDLPRAASEVVEPRSRRLAVHVGVLETSDLERSGLEVRLRSELRE